MAHGVARHLVAGVKRLHFGRSDAVAGVENARVDMERSPDSVRIEESDQAAVLYDAVVIAHGERLKLSLRIQKTNSHFSAFLFAELRTP